MQRKENLCKFEPSLVYKAISRTARAITQEALSGNTKKKQQNFSRQQAPAKKQRQRKHRQSSPLSYKLNMLLISGFLPSISSLLKGSLYIYQVCCPPICSNPPASACLVLGLLATHHYTQRETAISSLRSLEQLGMVVYVFSPPVLGRLTRKISISKRPTWAIV